MDHEKDSLTAEMFREWVAQHEDTDYVREQRIAITRMHKELFGGDQVAEGQFELSHIDFSADLPVELTKETYI